MICILRILQKKTKVKKEFLLPHGLSDSKYFLILHCNIKKYMLSVNLNNEWIKQNAVLKKLCYNVETGSGSANELYKQASKEGIGISLDDVKAFLKKQPIKKEKQYQNYNSYSAPFARFEYQLDIMDMISLMKHTGTFQKKTFRYGLICIDIFSKNINVVTMENRGGTTVYDAILQCFKVLGHPMSLYTDDDGEFKCKDYKIRHITSLTHANVAERAIRTMKKMLSDRIRVVKQPWTTILAPVFTKYNQHMTHGTTQLTPNEAHKDENEVIVTANSVLKEKYLRRCPNLNVGDTVKIDNKGKGNYTSRKETSLKWKPTIYTIKNLGTDLILNKYYEIEGLSKI